MKPKCDELIWTVEVTGERVVAAMSFKDFEQSNRFVALLIKFIIDERKPSDILQDIVWYCPPHING